MSDENEFEVESDDDSYIPEALGISDGSFVIFDPAEFAEVYNCHGVMMMEGNVFVLCRDTSKWRNVEPDVSGKPKLKRVQ